MPLWSIAVRLCIVVLVVRRLWIDALKAWRGEIPLTRLVVPALILCAALLAATHIVPRAVAWAGLFVVDLVFLALSFSFVRTMQYASPLPSEQRLQEALSRFFPPWFAGLVSMDITVLSHVLLGVRAFINPGRPSPFSYVEGSKIVMVAVIMGVAVVPDAFLFWLLLPHALWWLALALNLLDIWACLWFFGLYGTMVRRPHEVSPERIVLRNGILQTVEIDPGGIEDVRELGIVKRWKLPRRRGEASAVLGLGGVAMVAIRLAEPAFERHAFFPRPRKVREVFVASDAPAAFCSAVRELVPARLSVR